MSSRRLLNAGLALWIAMAMAAAAETWAAAPELSLACAAPTLLDGPAAPSPPQGFVAVFNRRDLTGWGGSLKDWTVEDGILTGRADGTLKQNRFIVWRGGSVKNFELRVKVKVSPGGNSGLQYRSVERPDLGDAVVVGYQCDVVSNRPDYNGMLYEERGRRILAHTGEKVVIDPKGQPWVVASLPLIDFAAGEWHDYRVLAEANHMRHWIDGQTTVDVVDLDQSGRRLEGVLGVQVHVGPPMTIQYRDFFLKTLPDDLPMASADDSKIPAAARQVEPQGRDRPRKPDAARPRVRAIGVDDAAASAMAVRVDGSLPLVHTEQFFPIDRDGSIFAPGEAAQQAEILLAGLKLNLELAGSNLERLVKLNVYAANTSAIAAFQKALVRRCPPGSRPAISYVVGTLARPGATLALDAVAAADPAKQDVGTLPGWSHSILPPGARIYISGQADPGKSLGEATRNTLQGLDATLRFLNLDRSRVVQAKAFLQPIASAGESRREILEFFGGDKSAPPLVFVEWTMSAPIEIELVVAGAEGGSEPVEFLTPPALKPSPVFSRVARVNRGDLIFTSGLYGLAGKTGAEQVEATFDSVRTLLNDSGSDFRHLVKATYYITDDATSRALNDIRPRFYDPTRPPAASKASVSGVGIVGRNIMLDLIAVPAR
jgi:enamine deaminase RidA (YjgF/YER057c/UK114 family)